MSAFLFSEKDVLRQYSNFIIDKTPNAMRISEHEVRFLDKTDHAFGELILLKPSHHSRLFSH